MRKRLAGFGHNRQVNRTRKVINVIVPIVGQKTKLNARVTATCNPGGYLMRDIVGGTRDNRVIDIEQHAGKPTLNQVALNINLSRAGKISIWIKKTHGSPSKPLAYILAKRVSNNKYQRAATSQTRKTYFKINSKRTDKC
jgi:hypothetical protein